MTTQQPEAPRVTSLDHVLNEWTTKNGFYESNYYEVETEQLRRMVADLRDLLREREDNMADVLRLAGVQFGLFSEIVAEVLAEVGLGTPISAEQRAFVKQQFVDLMNRLASEHGQ